VVLRQYGGPGIAGLYSDVRYSDSRCYRLRCFALALVVGVIATETYQGKAPKRYEGPVRECFRGDKCATKAQCGKIGKVNSYATPHEYALRPPVSILLCESCEREKRDKGLDALELVRSDQGRAPKQPKARAKGKFEEGLRLGGLRDARDRAGFSQKALSLLAGISEQHISNMEREKCGASEEVAVNLAGVLGVEVSELRGEE
jgi:DNA-binding XRE family transcriptional regulator